MDIDKAHTFCRNNAMSIILSPFFGCFHCKKIFETSKLVAIECTDNGRTALCPFCDVDSLLGSRDVPVTEELLAEMYKKWFE